MADVNVYHLKTSAQFWADVERRILEAERKKAATERRKKKASKINELN